MSGLDDYLESLSNADASDEQDIDEDDQPWEWEPTEVGDKED